MSDYGTFQLDSITINTATQAIASDTMDRMVYFSNASTGSGEFFLAFSSADLPGNAYVVSLSSGDLRDGFVLPSGYALWVYIEGSMNISGLYTKVPAAQLSLGSC